jgi:excisionase family DNA binding protein
VERSEREDSFLTVAEVADVLKLNQQTVRNWIDQGSLPALRVGRRVRIRRSDFERLVTEGFNGSRTAGTAASDGPNADDFWGGEPVGLAEPSPVGPLGPGPAEPLAPDPAEPPGSGAAEPPSPGPAGPPRPHGSGA